MKVVLVGANGQLGKCLQDVFPDHWEIFCFTSSELNVTDLNSTLQIKDIQPNVIINASAYTKVDLAETEVDAANAVNGTGVYHLANIAKECDARFIHVSTDYVFDGTKRTPYKETDVTSPINVYGQSKLAGENLALATHVDTLVLRTSWVFSEYGNNFLKTMLKLGESRDHLRVVGDQIGAPTYAGDIANAIIHLIQNQKNVRGIVNISGKDICNWAEFATAIFQVQAELNPKYKIPNVEAITTSEYPTAAKRPLYSVLDISISIVLNLEVRTLAKNIRHCVIKLMH